ncbi:MAG: acetylglutamate kinase [Thermoanaerobaculia bacterium]
MIVIKLGGRVQSQGELVSALLARWNAAPGAICVVHGGGDEVSTLQRQAGREPTFINGRRVTSDEDMDLVRMVLSGSANKRLVSSLVAAGLPAVGISGEDAGLIEARPIDLASFGRSGTPVAIRTHVLESLLLSGFMPVISPVARDISRTGAGALNVNGDDAAAAIASALRAELWMIADVKGVLDADRNVISSVDEAATSVLVSSGVVNKGMHAKLEAGFAAISKGATAVRIAGLEALTSAGVGQGTLLTASTS